MPATVFNKPTSLPQWADDSSAAREEPSPAKKGKGWEFAEKPPHEWFNWWMNNVYLWVGYVSQMDAADLPATHGGATTTTQAALTDLATRLGSAQTGIDTLVAWATTAQTNLTNLSAQAERQQRATSGGVMISGTPWPNYSATNLTQPAGSWAYDASNTAYIHGMEHGNLTVQGVMRIQDIRSLFVLRVHGDLTVNGTLRFLAKASHPSSAINLNVITDLGWMGSQTTVHAGDVTTVSTYPFGGGGLIGAGGAFVQTPYTVYTSVVDPTNGFLRGQGLFSGIDGLQEQLVRAGVTGTPMAMAPWLGGGGQIGGPSKLSSGAVNARAAGGGAAMLLVSGDIIVGPSGSISCSGEEGASTNGLLVGGGGGGGGALYVYCGGQIRFTGTSTPHQTFLADGGRGGRADTSGGTQNRYGGCGGGGGLVLLCARNADANLHCRASGGAAGWLSANNAASGNAGTGGRVVAVRALPSMLI